MGELYADLPVVEIAQAAALSKIDQDRRRFRQVLIALVKKANELGLVAGDGAGARLLVGRPVGLNDVLTFHAADPEKAARAMVVAASRVAPKTFYVRSEHAKDLNASAVKAEGRVVLRVKGLPIFKAAPVTGGLVRRALPPNGDPLRPKEVLPAEVQLVRVYAELCDPGRAADWESTLRLEERLRGALYRGLHLARKQRDRPPPQNRKQLAMYLETVATSFFSGEGRALVPRCGRRRSQRLRGVSSRGLAAELRELVALAAKAGIRVEGQVYSVDLPGQVPQRRLTLYAADRSKKTACLDVYDTAERELVPTTGEAGVATGSLFARMRFDLLDLWTARLLAAAGELPDGAGNRLESEILAGYWTLAAQYVRARANEREFASLLPVESGAYVGQWQNAALAEKRAMRGPPKVWLPLGAAV